jgi:hypothetical protein
MEGLLVNDEVQRLGREMVVYYFGILPRYLPGGVEGKHGKPH